MILGPNDPRAIRKGDRRRIIATGATMQDFDKFLETSDGQALVDLILVDWKNEDER